MKLQSVRGMNDIIGDDAFLWRHIESKARKVFESFGYQEIRTPILEPTQLFHRGVGEATDIVEKEMYTFEDRNGESLSMRPEGTASVVRALIEHNYLRDNPVTKFYYLGPMFRHERPQKGRYRQFYQMGVELYGVEGPLADLEILNIQHNLMTSIGVQNVEMQISSLGDDTCRPPYRKLLTDSLRVRQSELCEDCIRRIDTNPLRVLDCKVEACKKVANDMPKMLDHLCAPCKEHFDAVCSGLIALNIPFQINKKIVRGIDYYTRTAFEFVAKAEEMGSQATVSAGGRYDKLVHQLGGPMTPAVGFASGIERLSLLLQGLKEQVKPTLDLYCVIPDPAGLSLTLQVADQLRQRNLRVEVDLQQKAMKNQMKRANKLNANYCLILGSQEIENKIAILKNMKDQTQDELPLEKLDEELLKRFKSSVNFKF